MSVEDLHQILFTHWALDTTTYADKMQRVQVATGLLLASFTGCRPISLFTTGRKSFTDASDEDTQFLPDLEPDEHRSEADSDRNNSDNSDSGSGSGSESDPDELADRTGSLRYQDIDLFLVPPKRHGDPNQLLANVTLVHTKGEQRRSRSST